MRNQGGRVGVEYLPPVKVCVCACFLERVLLHPGKKLQIWGLQHIRLSQQGPPQNSVLGAGLKVNISLILTQFSRLLLENVNLQQKIILYASLIHYAKVRYFHCPFSE